MAWPEGARSAWEKGLYAVDIETGKQMWNFKTADAVRSVPVIADGVVYFGSYDGHLYAVR